MLRYSVSYQLAELAFHYRFCRVVRLSVCLSVCWSYLCILVRSPLPQWFGYCGIVVVVPLGWTKFVLG